MSSTEIAVEMQLPMKPRRVRQILRRNENLKWLKIIAKPKLKPQHKIDRLNFAQQRMSWSAEWRKIIFSDEKKFNLDGPDGLQYYWHDLRAEPSTCFSRNFGGGSLMVWAAFTWNARTPICFVSARINSDTYMNQLEGVLLPFLDDLEDEEYIFMHDNASIHRSSATKKWLAERNVDVLPWPAISPDLNPIENIWGMLARAVYANGRQWPPENSHF